MTQTGRSESIAAPAPAFAALGTHARKPGADARELSAQKRFTELLRQAKVRPAQTKALMGHDAGKDRIEAKAERRDDRKKDVDGTEAQAANAVAVSNPDVLAPKSVAGASDGGPAASVNQAGSTPPGAETAGSKLAGALAELLETASQAGPTQAGPAQAGTARVGSDQETGDPAATGPGNPRGVPPGGGGGTGQGPEIGSITQVEATDVSQKSGSQPQGPGANLPPIALDDLAIAADAQPRQGGTSGDGQTGSDADSATDAAAQVAVADMAAQAGETPASATFGAEVSKADAPSPSPSQVAQAANQAELSRSLDIDDPSNPAPLRSAIVEHIEQSSKGGNPSIRLVLNPEHLGEVQVKVTLVNGAINAMVRVENAAVSDAVQNQLESLRAALVDQGIKIDKLEVSVSGGSDRQQQDAYAGGNFGQGAGAQSQSRQDGTWGLPGAYRQGLGQEGAEEADLAGTETDPALGPQPADRPAGLDVKA